MAYNFKQNYANQYGPQRPQYGNHPPHNFNQSQGGWPPQQPPPQHLNDINFNKNQWQPQHIQMQPQHIQMQPQHIQMQPQPPHVPQPVFNNWQAQQSQPQQELHNSHQNSSNWKPSSHKQYAPVETTSKSSSNSKKKQRKRRKSNYKNVRLDGILSRFGGAFGAIAMIVGIVAILSVAIGMALNEITNRDRGTAATKCGFFHITLCNEFIVGTLKQNFDVDCSKENGMDCCTFKAKDACDLDYICGKTNPDCVYCHNLNAGTVFFWCSIIGLIVLCVSTFAICVKFTRKIAWIGYLIASVVIVIGLIAYPLMLGSGSREGVVNEKGCGDNALCCYYTDCDDGRNGGENCPTPFSKTYIAMIASIALCLICIILLCIMGKR